MCSSIVSFAFAKKHSVKQKHERMLTDELNALHKYHVLNNIADNLEDINKLKKELDTIQNDSTASVIIPSKHLP